MTNSLRESAAATESDVVLSDRRRIGLRELGGHGAVEPSIIDLSYEENPEREVDVVARLHERFQSTGLVIPEPQYRIYQSIKEALNATVRQHPEFPSFVWNPKVIDVGCGCGVGSNILSQCADLVWGIDKSVNSITYARRMFERTKTTLYWSPQLSFDVIDVTNESRELMQFDIVVCVEVIEHVADYRALLRFLQRSGKRSARYFISSPNRAAWAGAARAKKPLNPYHVREWTAPEFMRVLLTTFTAVTLHDCNMVRLPESTTVTPVLAVCTR